MASDGRYICPRVVSRDGEDMDSGRPSKATSGCFTFSDRFWGRAAMARSSWPGNGGSPGGFTDDRPSAHSVLAFWQPNIGVSARLAERGRAHAVPDILVGSPTLGGDPLLKPLQGGPRLLHPHLKRRKQRRVPAHDLKRVKRRLRLLRHRCRAWHWGMTMANRQSGSRPAQSISSAR